MKFRLFKNIFKKKEEITIEDILKIAFNCEYNKLNCTINDLKNLKYQSIISTSLEKIEKSGLITFIEDKIKLTDRGRTEAIKIIRKHRIIEKYLAENTGLNQLKWHTEADIREHQLEYGKIDQMSMSMGNPVFDPHGDPIPSESGELPLINGKTMSLFEVNDLLRVINIEDEPPDVYKNIVSLDIFKGAMLKISDKSDTGIKAIVLDKSVFIDYSLTSNIICEISDHFIDYSITRLSKLKKNETAFIYHISDLCTGLERRRMMDLGIVPGAEISIASSSPLGDPKAYNIMGSTLALRNIQAEQIFITFQPRIY